MQNIKANERTLELGTDVDIKNLLIQCTYRFHRLVQRERCTGMIQTTRLVHHMFIERRHDLARQTVVHRPRHTNHRTEPSKLHRRRQIDHLAPTLFVSGIRPTCRDICKFGTLQIAPDDSLECEVPVMESERGLEWLCPICETMARKVNPFVPANFFNNPGNT